MVAIPQPLRGARRAIPAHIPTPSFNWWALAAFAILGLSAMLPVLQNSAATSSGFDIQQAKTQKARLNGDIRALESDVASLTSLQRIERRATEIGLERGTNPIYVTITELGPAPAKIPSEYLPAPILQRDEPENWWRSLFSRVPLP